MNKLENFRCLYISYKNAPLSERSMFYLNESETHLFSNKVADILSIQEMFIVATCNRFELYYVHEEDVNISLIGLLKSFKGISQDSKKLMEKFTYYIGRDACTHLFRVSLGLESQILGDLQIITQIKKAYQISCDANVAGIFLHRLLHAIFYTNKQVVQSTSFKEGTASTSYACYSLANQLSKTFIDPQILVVGAGSIGKDVCLHLSQNGFKNVTILNRTIEKAESLAKECNFSYGKLEELTSKIESCQIIISTVEHNTAIITKDMVDRMDIGLKFFIDLSVPNSIESTIEQLSGVEVFNIDDLQQDIEEVQEKRKNAIPVIEGMISDALHDFCQWTEEISVNPVIKQLKSSLNEIRMTEIAKFTPNISLKEKDLVEAITENMIQKIIKFPVMELKSACKRGEEEQLSEMIQNLFKLEKTVNVEG